MIRALLDLPNLITLTGLALAIGGFAALLSGAPAVAIVCLLWALLADHVDGLVARRMANRAPGMPQIGKQLDSLTDMVTGGAFPAVLLLQASGSAPWAIAIGIAHAVAVAVRLGWFTVHGLDGGRFHGVPMTWNLPVVAVVHLATGGAAPLFPVALASALAILAVLHLAPVRVPPIGGVMYLVVTAFVAATTVFLIG